MAFHLAVASDVFDGVLFCDVPFFQRDVFYEIRDYIRANPENSFIGKRNGCDALARTQYTTCTALADSYFSAF